MKQRLQTLTIRILLSALFLLLLPTYAWEATAIAPVSVIFKADIPHKEPLPMVKLFRTVPKKTSTASNESLFSFSVLSDIHVGAEDEDSQKRFRAALADHHLIRPDSRLMVLNGDLSNGNEADNRSLVSIMSEQTLPPVHATMGNHEYYGMWQTENGGQDTSKLNPKWTSQKAIDLFHQMFNYEKPYHELVMEDYHFLFLGGEFYRDVDPNVKEDAYLSTEQLRWFQEKLKASAAAAPDKPIFVFLHQPLVHTVDGSDQELGVVQHEELRAIVNAYPNVVFFSGHTHWNLETTKQIKQLEFLAVSSASVQEIWNSNNEPEGSAASQSIVVDVYTDRIVIHGREHSEKRWIEPAFVKRYGGNIKGIQAIMVGQRNKS